MKIFFIQVVLMEINLKTCYNLSHMKYDDFILDLLEKAEEQKVSGDHETAIKTCQKIILEQSDCYEAFEELGDNYISLRQLSKAEKALKQSIKINPEASNAHYLLGFLFSLQEEWEKSVEQLQTADDLMPNHPEILRCMGWSYYNQNRQSQRGIAILERSKNLSPNDPNVLCDLGVCYMNSNQHLKAIPLFEQVIKLSPNSGLAEECRKFLQILKG